MKPADANNPRPILVASNLDQNALLMHHAAAQARRTDARVILVHVVPPHPADKKTSPGMVTFAEPAVCRAVLGKLELAALQLLWHGIVCDPIVLKGDPAEQIAAIARARGADRVLAASQTSPDNAAVGESSLVERLLGTLEIPLFVFGPNFRCPPETAVSDGRILLPMSLRHHRPDYVEFGTKLARETRSRLALLHVVSGSDIAEHQRQQLQTSARTRLAALAASQPNPLFPIEILVREGDVVQCIVEEAMCPHRDLIVLGTGTVHHGAASQTGVVHEVIAQARCPVVALRPSRHSRIESSELAVMGAAGTKPATDHQVFVASQRKGRYT